MVMAHVAMTRRDEPVDDLCILSKRLDPARVGAVAVVPADFALLSGPPSRRNTGVPTGVQLSGCRLFISWAASVW